MRRICRYCMLVSVFGAGSIDAQEISYDGNRWYDVEVSIFTNEVPGGERSELPVPHKLSAAYLPRLRELQSRSTAFLIDFPEDQLPGLLPAQPAAAPEVPAVQMGPIYSPAVRDGFKIPDFARDAFIDLDARAAQFSAMNRSIEASPEHRVLWHKVWRQPLETRAQTPAIFVGGGDMRGEHYEIEGSMRIVDNAGGPMLDINVWLNEFTAAGFSTDEWTLPMLPFPPAETEVDEVNDVDAAAATSLVDPAWALSAVWQLAQTRELSANQLYYLDHPALGVLIQVRPYVLPPRLVIESEADF